MTEPADSTLAPEDRRAIRGSTGPRPQLYLVLAADQPGRPGSRHGLHGLERVLIGRGEPQCLRVREGSERHLVLRVQDRWMSSAHVRLTRVLGRWMIEDAPSKNGTLVNGQPVSRAVLADGDLIEAGHTLFLFREAVDTSLEEPEDLEARAARGPAFGLATLLPPLAREFERIVAAARSREEVVLFGESGTGKEVIARAVHDLSGRSGAFVAVNCGAIPEALVESELFGYRKGAHSEAREDRPGLVRSADRGTLFLDEIGDLPLGSQVKFLRVLQEREVVPLGATRPVPVDIRLVAATHQDLPRRVSEGRFRPDLFARLAGFSLTLPPLRERREDFGLLVAEILGSVDGAEGLRLSTDAARALLRHRWPLNIRELVKSLRTAAVLAAGHGKLVEVEDLPREVQAALEAEAEPGSGGDPEPPPPEDELSDEDRRRREQLMGLLLQHSGNVSAVSRALGKARMQVQRWLKRYRIDAEQYRRTAPPP